MDKRQLGAIAFGLAVGISNAMLLTSCITVAPDPQSHRLLDIKLPTPAKNPTVSYMTVELDDLTCDQLTVALDAIPKPGSRLWGRAGTDILSSQRAWEVRRRVQAIEGELAARCGEPSELRVAIPLL